MKTYNDLTISQLKNLCNYLNCEYCEMQNKYGCIKTALENIDLNKEIDLEQIVYEKKCVGCEYENRCHVNCETCEEYQEELQELEEMINGDEDEEKKMNKKELKDLQDKTYAISWSGFPIGGFFNDIMKNTDPNFNKESAFQDLKKIIDEIYVLREKAKKYDEKEKAKRIDVWSDGRSKYYYCPSCEKRIDKYSYCKYCGQKLKGDEENE